MALVFHAKQDKRVTEMNHNPRRHSFQQIKALIVLEAVSAKEKMQEPQSNQYLKRSLFIKDRSIHFHITSTRALIKKVTSYPYPQSLMVRFNQQPNHTYYIQSSMISIDSNIGRSLMRSLIYKKKV